MGDRIFRQGTTNHIPIGGFHRFLNRGRNLNGFAVSVADSSLPVANNHQCRKAEPTSTFDHTRTASYLDDAFRGI
jgi:hypothetical protein